MRKFWAAALLAITLTILSLAQMKMTVSQLKGFVRSSVQLKHDDKRVADYLKKVTLTERLDDNDLEEMVTLGAGPKTMSALEELKNASAALPKAVVEPQKPAAAVIPPPSPEDQKRIIEEAREVALNYSKRLPDFICLQVTRRYYDPSGLEYFSLADTVATRLSYFEQKEDYKVISVNGKMTDVSYDKLGGATSSGEFGSMMREIFEPISQTEFHWERWAKLRGRITHVYGYRVSQPRSRWSIVYDHRLTITPAYRGWIYVDKDAPMVMRITLEAEDIPSTFPIQQASNVLDYDFTTISEKEFLLPLRAEMRMREGRVLAKNVVEFRNYRKFGAEATITFDVPDALPEDKTKEKPPQ